MFDEDLTVFFDEFAESATLNGKAVKVLYNVQRVEHNDGFSQFVGTAKTIVMPTASFETANAVQGSSVVFRSQNYVVSDFEDDGTGVTTVTLNMQ